MREPKWTKKSIVKMDITVDTEDNQLLNDAIGAVARLVYLMRRIPSVQADYVVTSIEEQS